MLLPEQDLSCFSLNYSQARKLFLSSLDNVPSALLQEMISFQHPLCGPDSESLFTDVILLGQTSQPENLMIVISATHGVEGFTGSAIQSNTLPVLTNFLSENADFGVMFIHALNPWGFAWLRRYDHDGIDLNRNFINFSDKLPQNPAYSNLHQQILKQKTLIEVRSFLHKQNLAQFTEIWTRGQYSHDDGFFFGGFSPSWSRNNLEQISQHIAITNAQRIAVIDLHTGLGPYGYGEIINDHKPGSTGFHWAETLYGNNAQSAFLGNSCSTVKDGLLDYHWHQLIGDRGCFVTLEFGTYPISGLIEALIMEQIYYNHSTKRDIKHPSVEALKQFFYPQEKSWQQQVLFRSKQILSMAIEGLMS